MGIELETGGLIYIYIYIYKNERVLKIREGEIREP